MRKVRENILTVDNYPFFGFDDFASQDRPATAGGPGAGTFTAKQVWITTADGKSMPNGLMTGQPVVYNPDTGYCVNPLDWNDPQDRTKTPLNKRLVWGVGTRPKGGAATSIKKVFGDALYLHDVQAVTHEPPSCGYAPVKDLFYDCLHCEEDFTIGLMVEDDITQNQYPYNRPAQHSLTVSTDCCACDDCNGRVDADKLTKAIVAQANSLHTTKTKRSRFRKPLKKRLPVTAVQLYGDAAAPKNTSMRFCLTIDNSDCENCNLLNAFDTFTIGAGTATVSGAPAPANDITVDITGLQDANKKIGVGTAPLVVSMLNEALGEYGSAVLVSQNSGDARGCCAICIEINADFEMDGSEIGPAGWATVGQNVLLSDPVANASSQYGKTFTSGVRFMADPVELQCIDSINRPRGIYYRTFDVVPGQDFACGSYAVVEVQPLVIPRNLGYHWRWREFAQDVGGHARNANPWGYDPRGNLGYPLAGGRLDQVTAECAAGYHTFILEHSIPTRDIGIHGRSVHARGRSIILVKDTDVSVLYDMALAFDQTNTFELGKFSQVVASDEPRKDVDQTENIDVDGVTYTDEPRPNTSQGHIQ